MHQDLTLAPVLGGQGFVVAFAFMCLVMDPMITRGIGSGDRKQVGTLRQTSCAKPFHLQCALVRCSS